jgi:hypothetical protein
MAAKMTNRVKLIAQWTSRFDPFLVAGIIVTWAALLPRIVPDWSSDRGIFISVAARLLAGDTLYAGVYDNKEPLFYYLVAGELTLGRWSEVAIEALMVATAASATFLIAIKLASRWTAMAISFIAVPIIVTGEFYLPGYTELLGIALTLVTLAACAHERPIFGGVCIGLLLFTKLVFVPLVLVGAGCFSSMGRQFLNILLISLGALASTLLIVAVLFFRAELLPFMDNVRLNIAYSQGGLIGPQTGLALLAAHLKRVGGWSLLAELLPILIGIIISLVSISPKSQRDRNQAATSAATIAIFVSSLAILSITGLHNQHNQILYIPAILVVLSLSQILDAALEISQFRTLMLIFLIGFLMAGTFTIREDFNAMRAFPRSYAALDELSPETRRVLSIGSSGTYARFGKNDDNGEAVGLGNWKLACPRFHQYAFQPATLFSDVFKCGSTAPVLIIADSLVPEPGRPSWNEFVAKVEHLLTHAYSCDANSGLRVCTRYPNR